MTNSRNLITFLSLTAIVSLSLVAKLNLPQNGENAYLQQIVLPDNFSKDRLWDFSACEIVGDPIEVYFDRRADSCLSATLPGIRYDFIITGDTVFHSVTETHYQCMTDTIPCVYALPTLASSFSAPYATRGRAYHSEYIDAHGDMSLAPVGCGTVILPTGDTIANVTLSCFSTSQYITKAYHRQPSSSAVGNDSLIHRIVRRYNWQSESYPVPLVCYSISTDSLGGQQLGTTKISSLMCPPVDQPRRSFNRNFNRQVGTGSPIPLDDGENLPLVAMTLTVGNGSVLVIGTASRDVRISMILTDIVGRVFSSMPASEFSAGSSVEWSADGLPAGQYVLYIGHDDSDPIAHKLIVH